MCECASWRWIPDLITDNGRWPLPDHHPSCKEYKTEKYVRITFDSSYCVVNPIDAKEFADEDEHGEYEFADIDLTKDQFEKLPEFQGF